MLVDLVGSVKTFPVAVVIQTVRQALKAANNNLEVSTLQFFSAYLSQACTPQQTFECWSALAQLLKDCLTLNLSPSGIFLALSVLNEFVQRSTTSLERKEQKELQVNM